MSEDALERLHRWELAGGTWQIVDASGNQAVVGLFRCDGGEEVDRFETSDPRIVHGTG